MKKDEIISIMKQHPTQVLEILTYQEDYKQSVVSEVLKSQFEKFAKENHFELIDTDNFFSGKKGSSLSFRKAGWKNAVISIVAENRMNNYWIAIMSRPGSDPLNTPLMNLSHLPEKPAKSWPFGWQWLPSGYWRLYSPETVAAILNQQFISTVGGLISSIASDFESLPNYREI